MFSHEVAGRAAQEVRSASKAA